MVFMRENIKDTLNQKLGFYFVNNIYLTLDKKSVPRDALEIAELKESIAKLSSDSSDPV